MKGAAFYAIGRIFAAAAFPISPTSAFFFTFDFFSFLGLIFLYKGAAPSIDINFNSSLPRVTPGGAGGAPSPQSEIMAPHARSMNFFSQQIDNVNNVNITSRPPPFLSTEIPMPMPGVNSTYLSGAKRPFKLWFIRAKCLSMSHWPMENARGK